MLVKYVRVSKDDRARGSRSLEDQSGRGDRALAALEIVSTATFIDNGVSGKISPQRRPGLSAALERLRDPAITGLWVDALDRLTRDTEHFLRLVRNYFAPNARRLPKAHPRRAAGALLVVDDQEIDLSDPTSWFMSTMRVLLAEYERRRVGERVERSAAQRKRQGLRTGQASLFLKARFTPVDLAEQIRARLNERDRQVEGLAREIICTPDALERALADPTPTGAQHLCGRAARTLGLDTTLVRDDTMVLAYKLVQRGRRTGRTWAQVLKDLADCGFPTRNGGPWTERAARHLLRRGDEELDA